MGSRLAFGLGLFVGSLLVGWWLGQRGVLLEVKAKRLMWLIVTRVSPIVLCLSFWRLGGTDARTFVLPLIGCVISASTLLPAWGYARWAGLTRPQIGSFLTCAMFSNVGFLGAFIAFALFGEQGYSVAMLYLIFFNPCFYSIGFGVAKRFGHTPDPSVSGGTFSDELRWYPFLGLLGGMALGLAKVPRPEGFERINQVLIPIDMALYLMAIGSQLQVELSGRWWQACLAMSAIKFWYTPLIGWALVELVRLEGLPRFIVLLQASMPIAISPLMLPMFFGLDHKLSNALWFATTALAIPWLLIYLLAIR